MFTFAKKNSYVKFKSLVKFKIPKFKFLIYLCLKIKNLI